MRYAYRCTQCSSAWPPRPNRREARRDRELHRRLAHLGAHPDGERIQPVPGLRYELAGVLVHAGRGAATWWRQAPTARTLQTNPQWRTALWVMRGLLILALAYLLLAAR